MTALALTAVGGTRRETSVALSANLLVAVVLAGEHLERGLDDSSSESVKDGKRGKMVSTVVTTMYPSSSSGEPCPPRQSSE